MNRNLPVELRYGEPPSPGEAMADDWRDMGFRVLEHEGDPPSAVWLECLMCEGAHVHVSAVAGHVGERCTARHTDSALIQEVAPDAQP